jgi:alpha-L-fucosidase 2
VQPPWSCNYTTNINLEMNYWSAEVTNLAECASPLFDLVDALAITGARTARDLYDAPGWVAHHNTDAWAYSRPVGLGQDDPKWAFWPFAGPWLVRHLMEHVEFGCESPEQSEQFARERAWPVIRSAAEFYIHWLVELGDGALGTSPSTSPENEFEFGGTVASVADSSTMDMALVDELFASVGTLAGRLGFGDDSIALEAASCRVRLSQFPQLTEDGRIREWRQEFIEVEPEHRHLSPLYFAFPGRLAVAPNVAQAVSASLDARGNHSTGWSIAWKTAIRARLHQPEVVQDLLETLFSEWNESAPWPDGMSKNLFNSQKPFQIDGNLGVTAAIAESLLQSHGDRIELLPALPTVMSTGAVTGLVARPGIIVDIEWFDGRLVSVDLQPRHTGTAGSHLVSYRGLTLSVELSAGERHHLVASDFEQVPGNKRQG